MARIIPNENTWIGFVPTLADYHAVAATALDTAVNLTGFTISLNASSRGNTVPTPSFDTLFETSVSGTTTATFDADFYRDDTVDTAWTTLPRGTGGFFVIARYGGAGANHKPITGDDVEVWPIKVTSRTMANMTSNTVLTFTVSCSVPQEPDEQVTLT